eukprot:3975421-Pleurochrysis_carterae.AAC.1
MLVAAQASHSLKDVIRMATAEEPTAGQRTGAMGCRMGIPPMGTAHVAMANTAASIASSGARPRQAWSTFRCRKRVRAGTRVRRRAARTSNGSWRAAGLALSAGTRSLGR